jgi:alcohol dehydrogenase/L-iditol 2-dehydrogenase
MPAVVQFALQNRAVELREMAVPEIGADEVLLRVRGVGVCGSDVHQYHNTSVVDRQRARDPGPRVLRRGRGGGQGREGLQGRRPVTSETAAEIDFGSPLTRQGQYNLDPGRRGFGYEIHGAMAGVRPRSRRGCSTASRRTCRSRWPR